MTAYHLLVFAKVIIFGISQITLMALCVHLDENNDRAGMVCLLIYSALITIFFYWVYPITIS